MSDIPKILYVGEDNDVFWPAKRHDTEALLTNGTVTMQLLDSDDNAVSLASGAMAYDSTRLGWEGVVDEAAALTVDATYTLVITGDFSGPDGKRYIPCVAKKHGAK